MTIRGGAAWMAARVADKFSYQEFDTWSGEMNYEQRWIDKLLWGQMSLYPRRVWRWQRDWKRQVQFVAEGALTTGLVALTADQVVGTGALGKSLGQAIVAMSRLKPYALIVGNKLVDGLQYAKTIFTKTGNTVYDQILSQGEALLTGVSNIIQKSVKQQLSLSTTLSITAAVLGIIYYLTK